MKVEAVEGEVEPLVQSVSTPLLQESTMVEMQIWGPGDITSIPYANALYSMIH